MTYEEIFDKYAQKYQEDYFDVSRYSKLLDLFVSKIDQDMPRILDIACGPANMSAYVCARIPDAQITGIDISENMISLAQQNLPQADFRCKGFEGLNYDETYDHIICGFLLPYLNSSEKDDLFQTIHKLLNPGGYALISTMVMDDYQAIIRESRDGKESILMHYHSRAGIKKDLDSLGFKLLGQDEIMADNGDIDLTLLLQKIKL